MEDRNSLIEKYFAFTLLPDEKIRLQNLLETDANFAANFNEEKKLHAAIHLHNRANTKQQLIAIEAKQKRKTTILRIVFSVAASIVVLLGTYLFIFYASPNNQQLYASYYSTAPNIVAPIVRGDNNVNDTVQQAFVLYEQNKFSKAIELFDVLETNNTYKQEALFYKAICLMELKQTNEALQIFTSTNFSIEPYGLYYAAIWYKALCYLQLNETKKALQQLNILLITSNTYQQQSKALLKELQ